MHPRPWSHRSIFARRPVCNHRGTTRPPSDLYLPHSNQPLWKSLSVHLFNFRIRCRSFTSYNAWHNTLKPTILLHLFSVPFHLFTHFLCVVASYLLCESYWFFILYIHRAANSHSFVSLHKPGAAAAFQSQENILIPEFFFFHLKLVGHWLLE